MSDLPPTRPIRKYLEGQCRAWGGESLGPRLTVLKAKHEDVMLKPEWIYKRTTVLFLGDPYIPVIWSTAGPYLGCLSKSPH